MVLVQLTVYEVVRKIYQPRLEVTAWTHLSSLFDHCGRLQPPGEYQFAS